VFQQYFYIRNQIYKSKLNFYFINIITEAIENQYFNTESTESTENLFVFFVFVTFLKKRSQPFLRFFFNFIDI